VTNSYWLFQMFNTSTYLELKKTTRKLINQFSSYFYPYIQSQTT